jgi:hypothetical protein
LGGGCFAQRRRGGASVDFGGPVSDDYGVSVWRAYEKFWLDLRTERPRLSLLANGLVLALVFAAVGLVTATRWTSVVFIWALCNVGLIASQWWRGARRSREARAVDPEVFWADNLRLGSL